MTDHRRLQRALFRMQMDSGLAERVFAGNERAVTSIGLSEPDLALLRAADPAAVAADAGDQRKGQMLGNLASEYVLTAALGPGDLLARFPGSDAFHGAIDTDGSLPLAFGAWARAEAERDDDETRLALATLEHAMAVLRRRGEGPRAPAGSIGLSDRAALVEVPDGTLAFAAGLRDALQLNLPRPTPELSAAAETVLMLSASTSDHGLPDVQTERLEPAVAALLRGAEGGLDPAGRVALAARLGTSDDELMAFAETLIGDGVLVAG